MHKSATCQRIVHSDAAQPKTTVWRFVLIVFLLAAGSVLAAPTPAGTIISNQARAVIDGRQFVPSNSVDTVVLAVCRARFSPAGTAIAPGQSAAIIPPS